MKNNCKEDGNFTDVKCNNKDVRGRIPRVDPRMAEYMGRIYVDKDKAHYAEPMELIEGNTPSTRLKFKEYVHTKTKKEIIEEQEIYNAAIGLLNLVRDLKRKHR